MKNRIQPPSNDAMQRCAAWQHIERRWGLDPGRLSANGAEAAASGERVHQRAGGLQHSRLLFPWNGCAWPPALTSALHHAEIIKRLRRYSRLSAITSRQNKKEKHAVNSRHGLTGKSRRAIALVVFHVSRPESWKAHTGFLFKWVLFNLLWGY